ncbi:MAG: hypothetical protein KDA73_17095 [Rhodobacteraceae bacterium]|nr:hypothetical protein [Paracoccaceae bacterium]
MGIRPPVRSSRTSLRTLAVATVLASGLAGCTQEMDSATTASAIGDFRLDRLVVIADDPISGPVSRRVSDAELKAALTKAVDSRLRRFRGTGEYSIGIKVAGYVLAPRGVPLLTPKSQLFLNVFAYDATPARLNPEPLQLVVNERAGGDAVVGSGYSQTAEEQLAELAENAAIEIERWLRKNEAWFGGRRARGAAPLPLPAAIPTAPSADAAKPAPAPAIPGRHSGT